MPNILSVTSVIVWIFNWSIIKIWNSIEKYHWIFLSIIDILYTLLLNYKKEIIIRFFFFFNN